ncbi:DNA-binding response regulator [Chloroflexus islandicus]|uniref:DNA-binding response regulator n=1 Tax=Chloroflexus islandicus TaxID=1707952 RepID=A0A178MH48_9CHLR|nr:response regulator transcription factor [Chloroflexus islandicus]OAN47467.1 DNA-binding response regulator [Chloroflexus islandicus]
MATILIVEDERELALLLRQRLESEGHTALVVYDGPTALALAGQHQIDLVILDWMLPGLDGLTVMRRLRERSPVPVLMLTARSEEVDRVLGLEIGADDYVTKPFSLRELLARVHSILRRVELLRQPPAAPLIRIGDLTIEQEARRVTIAGTSVELTVKEFDLLCLLAAHPGRSFSRSYLLDRIWGIEYDGSDRTVDTHIVRLRRKLGALGERIVTVWGVGYRFEP